MEPPVKRPRLSGPTPFDDADDENEDELVQEPGEINVRRDPGMKLERGRAKAAFRLKSTFESIFAKYEQELEGDEIDLRTGEIVVNTGHVESLKDPNNGSEDGSDDEERILRGGDATKALVKASQPGAAARRGPPLLWGQPSIWGGGSPFGSGFGGMRIGTDGMPAADPAWQTPDLPAPSFSYGFGGFGGYSLGRGTHWVTGGRPGLGSRDGRLGHLGRIKSVARKTIQAPTVDGSDDDDILFGPQPASEAKLGHGNASEKEQTQGLSKETTSDGPGSDAEDEDGILLGPHSADGEIPHEVESGSPALITASTNTEAYSTKMTSSRPISAEKKKQGKKAPSGKDVSSNSFKLGDKRKRQKSIDSKRIQVTENGSCARPLQFVVELFAKPRAYFDQFMAIPSSPPSSTRSRPYPETNREKQVAVAQTQSPTGGKKSSASSKIREPHTLQKSTQKNKLPPEKPAIFETEVNDNHPLTNEPPPDSSNATKQAGIEDIVSTVLHEGTAVGRRQKSDDSVVQSPILLTRKVFDPSYEFSDEDEPLPPSLTKRPLLRTVNTPLASPQSGQAPCHGEAPAANHGCDTPRGVAPDSTTTTSTGIYSRSSDGSQLAAKHDTQRILGKLARKRGVVGALVSGQKADTRGSQLAVLLVDDVNGLRITNDERPRPAGPTGHNKSGSSKSKKSTIMFSPEAAQDTAVQTRQLEAAPACTARKERPKRILTKFANSSPAAGNTPAKDSVVASPGSLGSGDGERPPETQTPSLPPTTEVVPGSKTPRIATSPEGKPVSTQSIYDIPHSSSPPLSSDGPEQALPQPPHTNNVDRAPPKPQTPSKRTITSLASAHGGDEIEDDELLLPSSDMFTAFSSALRRTGSFHVPVGTNSPRPKSRKSMGYLREGSSPSVHVHRLMRRRGSSPIKSSSASGLKIAGRRDRELREKVLLTPRKHAGQGNGEGTGEAKGNRSGSPTPTLVETPGGTTRRCGEDGWTCGRDWCFTCLK